MSDARYWQNEIVFKDGHKTTLTIQSEKGRSDHSERVFVLQALGGVRACKGWNFSFVGSPHEVANFVPDANADMLNDQVPYWLGSPAESHLA